MNRHDGPDGLDQSERPGALQEAVDRTEDARAREREDKPAAAAFEPVGYEHRRDGE